MTVDRDGHGAYNCVGDVVDVDERPALQVPGIDAPERLLAQHGRRSEGTVGMPVCALHASQRSSPRRFELPYGRGARRGWSSSIGR